MKGEVGKNLTLKIPMSLRSKLEAVAAQEGHSISSLSRQILKEAVTKKWEIYFDTKLKTPVEKDLVFIETKKGFMEVKK